jgi:outer membrane protein assembly factor BamB
MAKHSRQSRVPPPSGTALAVGADGPVYGWAKVPGATAPGRVYALDTASGAVRWTSTPDGELNALLVANGRALYAGSGGVYALNPANGTVEWKFVSGKEFSGLVATNDGAIYTNSAGNIYVLDSSSGAVRLKFAGLAIGAVGDDGTVYSWSDGSLCAVSPP